MNSSVLGLSKLARDAFDECHTVAEMRYIADSLISMYKHHSKLITELFERAVFRKMR